jgi:hypothetical protein
LIPE